VVEWALVVVKGVEMVLEGALVEMELEGALLMNQESLVVELQRSVVMKTAVSVPGKIVK